MGDFIQVLELSDETWKYRQNEDKAADCYSYMGTVALAHAGKVSRLNKTRPQLLIAREMQPIPMMFITTPDLACRWHKGEGGRGDYDFIDK